LLDVFIGMITSWDAGILSSCTLYNDEKERIMCHYYKLGMKSSYMAIKKALYGRQLGIFVLILFYLLLQESMFF
jgi:hypothetical protein